MGKHTQKGGLLWFIAKLLRDGNFTQNIKLLLLVIGWWYVLAFLNIAVPSRRRSKNISLLGTSIPRWWLLFRSLFYQQNVFWIYLGLWYDWWISLEIFLVKIYHCHSNSIWNQSSTWFGKEAMRFDDQKVKWIEYRGRYLY